MVGDTFTSRGWFRITIVKPTASAAPPTIVAATASFSSRFDVASRLSSLAFWSGDSDDRSLAQPDGQYALKLVSQSLSADLAPRYIGTAAMPMTAPVAMIVHGSQRAQRRSRCPV